MKIQSTMNPSFLKPKSFKVNLLSFSGELDKLEKPALEIILPISKDFYNCPSVSVTAVLEDREKVFKLPVDTGSNMTSLALSKRSWVEFLNPFLKAVNLDAAVPLGFSHSLNQVNTPVLGYLIKSLLLGTQKVDNLIVGLKKGREKSLLGLDVLKNYRWTLDMKKKQLRLKKHNRIGSDNFYYVNVTLSNKHKARLLVDTGASVCLISSTLQQKLKFPKLMFPEVLETASGDIIKLPKVSMAFEEFQGYKMDNIRTVVADPASLEGVDGILGMNVLKHFICDFDPISGQMTLTKHEDAE